MSLFWRLRVLTFYIIITTIITVFFVFFCIPIKLFGAPYSFRYKLAVIFSYIFIYLMWFICDIKFKVEKNVELPQNNTPYIVISNHQSFWENFFMQLIVPKHSWVMKQELLDIPIFGQCLKALEPIAIDRKNKRSIIEILKKGERKIKEGLSIVIFPEAGTVNVNQNVRFKTSAAKLALNTKVPILLIALNSGLVWPKGFWFKRPGTITVKIMEIISQEYASTMDSKELSLYIEEKINS